MSHFKAAVCTALKGPDGIQLEHRNLQPIGEGQVRVAVQAAGLNFPDLLMTYGKYQFRPEPPFTPGMEFAGQVIEIAGDGSEFRIGDRVMGNSKSGCIAQQVVAESETINLLPDALSFEEGACWHTAALTAWHGLNDKADIKPGETLLVLGAAGGVGLAAVQLGKYRGAKVIASASTEKKRKVTADVGAHFTIDPADPDFAQKVKQWTGGKGADVVFDPVGGALAITATRSIAVEGRYLIVGFASGDIPSFPANHALIKEYSLIGMRAGESIRRDAELAKRTRKALAGLAENGIMRPHISHRFSLEETADALRVLEKRKAIGRVIITP